jgi:hypothetical protein
VAMEDAVVEDVAVGARPLGEQGKRVLGLHGEVAHDASIFWTWRATDGSHKGG